MRLRYLDYKSSLEAYSQIDNVILDDDSDFNLYIVFIIYYIVIVLNIKEK